MQRGSYLRTPCTALLLHSLSTFYFSALAEPGSKNKVAVFRGVFTFGPKTWFELSVFLGGGTPTENQEQ